MAEMRLCPECGSNPKWRYRKPYGWVECKKCKFRTSIFIDNYEEADCKDEAIKRWNEVAL